MALKNGFSFLLLGSLMSLSLTMSAAVTYTACFKMGPLGKVYYADALSTEVPSNERYALVFIADGYDFAGFTSDGKLVDTSKSLVCECNEISNIKDKELEFQLIKKLVQSRYLDKLGCTDGTFELYLLDSRVSSGYAEISTETKLPTCINAWVKVDSADTIKASTLVYSTSVPSSSGSLSTTQTLVIGTFVPTPVIVSMIHTNGVATVGVTNTVSTAKYILKGSLDLTFTNTVWSGVSQAGAVDVLTPLVLSDNWATNSASFYRIEVVK